MPEVLNSGRRPPGTRVLYLLAIAIAALGVAIAAIIYFTGQSPKAQPAQGLSPNSSEPTAADNGPKSTCSAWQDLKGDLVSATNLPADWTYDTPLIDTEFETANNLISTDLDRFKPRITPQPTDIAALAHAFVDKQSAEGPALVAHRFTPADQAGIDAAAHALDAACGIQ